MKKQYIAMVATVATFALPMNVQAEQTAKPKVTQDEECKGGEACNTEVMSKAEVLAWVGKNAKWALEYTKEELEQDDEGVLEEISEVIYEYEDYKERDPALAKKFLALEKMNFDLVEKLEKLEGKSKAEKKAALKEHVTALLKLELEFEKGLVELDIKEAKEELQSLKEAEEDIDDVIEETLEELLEDDEDES